MKIRDLLSRVDDEFAELLYLEIIDLSFEHEGLIWNGKSYRIPENLSKMEVHFFRIKNSYTLTVEVDTDDD